MMVNWYPSGDGQAESSVCVCVSMFEGEGEIYMCLQLYITCIFV